MAQKYDISEIAEKFNKTLKKIILMIDQSLTDNILFDTIKRRTMLITKSHPLLLLEEAGPQIFQYRDYIKNESEELINNLEDTVMNNSQMQDYIKDNSNDKDNILYLLGLIKSLWKTYNNDEKKMFHKSLKILLSEYCKYLTIKQ